MRKKADQYMPIGRLTRVEDILPPPKDLIAHEPMEKVTISLKQSSVDFFRAQSRAHHTKYQKMIREVLDRYASKYKTA